MKNIIDCFRKEKSEEKRKDFDNWDIVKDSVTGFTGVVSARTEWLNGCVRVLIQPQELKDGRPIQPEWMDVEQLELIQSGKKPEIKPTGGPQNDPINPVG